MARHDLDVTPRRTTTTRWYAGALALAAATGACVVETGDLAVYAWLWLGLQVAPVTVCGLLLARHRPDSAVASRVLSCGTALCVATVAEAALYRSADAPSWLIAALQVLQLGGLTWAAAALTQLLAVFPTGEPDSPAARLLLRISMPIAALTTTAAVLSRDSWTFVETAVWRPMPARFPLYVDALHGLRQLSLFLINIPTLTVTVGMVLLFRRRRQVPVRLQSAVRAVWRTSLTACVASVALAGLAAAELLSDATVAAVPCLALIPLGMGIATLRDDAFDLDLLVRRSALYLGASVLITAAIAGSAAVLGLTAGSRLPLGAAVALAVASTLALGPLRRSLEAVAGRWAFGQRVGGYDVMAQVGTALEHAYDLEALAPRLAEMVRDGLGLRWVRVVLTLDPALPDETECLGQAGEVEGPMARSVPLVHAGTDVGRLECGERVDGVLTAADDAVLLDLARQAGLALHNARLGAELAGRLVEIRTQAAELTASRTRLVQAQEVERRRLERDLHDGAQQEIVALMAKLRLARNRLGRGDQDGLDDLLDELQGDARGLLDDLRELAHGIRPPVLADRGLVGAIEARASRLPLDVAIEASPAVRDARYDDAVEGAAWFAVSELCANALKHSGAQQLVISLAEQDQQLLLRVSDNGCGIPVQRAAEGLRGLRDRVEALGGRLEVSGTPGAGTAVRVLLPARRRVEA